MANQELIDYIKIQLSIGTHKKDIRSSLKKAGWHARDVNIAIPIAKKHWENLKKKQSAISKPKPKPKVSLVERYLKHLSAWKDAGK